MTGNGNVPQNLQPEKFVDADTWQVRSFETPDEKLKGETLPRAAQAGGWALRLGALAAALPASYALIACAGIGGLAAFVGLKVFRDAVKQQDIFADDLWSGKYRTQDRIYKVFDVSDEGQVAVLQQMIGDYNPDFTDMYKKSCAVAGINPPPRVALSCDRVKISHKEHYWSEAVEVERPNQDNYLFAAMTKSDGSKPMVLMGDKALKYVAHDEAAAIIAHELTHVALGRSKKIHYQTALTDMNDVFVVLAGAAAVLTFSPVAFAVLGVSFAAYAHDIYACSVISRHTEKLCDRGAALITGQTVSLTDGIEKLRTKMEHAHRVRPEGPAEPRTLIEALKRPLMKWLHKQPLMKAFRETHLYNAINDSHPEDAVREKLLESYGHDGDNRHYLAWRAQQFRGAFLKAAVKADAPASDPKPSATLATGIVKPGQTA